MGTEQSWVDEMRARALATIVLTRHAGVDVIPVDRSVSQSGYDLLVRVKDQRDRWDAEFAVRARGTQQNVATTSGALKLQVNPEAIGDIDRPLVLFLFDIEREDGFYHWLKEPVIDADGKGTLRPSPLLSDGHVASGHMVLPGPGLRRLDNDATEEILCRILKWYQGPNQAMSSPMLQKRAG